MVLVFIITGCQKKEKTQPLLKNGLLDLRDWEFKKDSIVTLDGEWEFYWQKLLSPQDFGVNKKKIQPEIIKVPAIWGFYKIEGKDKVISPDGYGYATYRIKVLFKQAKYRSMGLRINQLNSACNVFIENIHPGEVLLEEFLKPLQLTAYRLARETHIPQTWISEIVHGRRSITADTALRLSKYFNTTPQFWLGLQNDYDLEEEKKAIHKELDSIHQYAVV